MIIAPLHVLIEVHLFYLEHAFFGTRSVYARQKCVTLTLTSDSAVRFRNLRSFITTPIRIEVYVLYLAHTRALEQDLSMHATFDPCDLDLRVRLCFEAK